MTKAPIILVLSDAVLLALEAHPEPQDDRLLCVDSGALALEQLEHPVAVLDEPLVHN